MWLLFQQGPTPEEKALYMNYVQTYAMMILVFPLLKKQINICNDCVHVTALVQAAVLLPNCTLYFYLPGTLQNSVVWIVTQ